MLNNLNEINERIATAAAVVGKSSSEIELIAVSKRFPEEMIDAASRLGVTVFGENRIQEAVRKAEHFKSNSTIRFHMIGNIQTNKAKYIKNHFDLIHTIDRKEIVDALDKRLTDSQDVLIQVNIDNEPQKSGVSVDGLADLIEYVMASKHLMIKGLMLIPPYYDADVDKRSVFTRMKKVFDYCAEQYSDKAPHSFDVLSMGMSGDFEMAIEEGATMIRVGSAIFGERPPLQNG